MKTHQKAWLKPSGLPPKRDWLDFRSKIDNQSLASQYAIFDAAVARVAAAVAAARKYDIVLTARADGVGKGVYGLDEAIRRLKAFEALGAEVLYAPGVPDLASLEQICSSVSVPVNHVLGQGVSGLTFEQIAGAGVRRISVGGSLARGWRSTNENSPRDRNGELCGVGKRSGLEQPSRS
ncbi:isocitrate lyase/phosphoenolpyruvate mutase family protein [Mesorhizobium sp. M0815]|uniref:isocitrate lyase/phosphoenolpyruvate mutase family protein n=1 Tax=Mesorhizobium sp. M0815 TaxID=2957005 RepID=UPI003339773B